ncbi:hypothetical protein [Mycobacterium parmense]|uniref:Uncharacterized protein n=1 Tax=Mycobacterium parmense TaxID=185642 RepID=A0A7I7Z3I9_9MYCO|nr:hypothetical protein [Mycobacterium parmense]MCV7352116.1 hypothetical protein [Mycobacterium parmense]BBZ48167.1 hypothetical protein MPRM_54480 [Mycobacterium parmense]
MALLPLPTRRTAVYVGAVPGRGKQSLLPFDDHAKTVRFKDLVNRVGTIKAFEIVAATERSGVWCGIDQYGASSASNATVSRRRKPTDGRDPSRPLSLFATA